MEDFIAQANIAMRLRDRMDSSRQPW